jgi:hypothetical protein
MSDSPVRLIECSLFLALRGDAGHDGLLPLLASGPLLLTGIPAPMSVAGQTENFGGVLAWSVHPLTADMSDMLLEIMQSMISIP